MKIFNKEMFGNDAVEWLNLPTISQVEWIKSNTNQQNDDIIDEFLSAVTKDEDKQCLNCGTNEHISKRISEQIVASAESIDNREPSIRNSFKRPNKTKSRKNK